MKAEYTQYYLLIVVVITLIAYLGYVLWRRRKEKQALEEALARAAVLRREAEERRYTQQLRERMKRISQVPAPNTSYKAIRSTKPVREETPPKRSESSDMPVVIDHFIRDYDIPFRLPTTEERPLVVSGGGGDFGGGGTESSWVDESPKATESIPTNFGLKETAVASWDEPTPTSSYSSSSDSSSSSSDSSSSSSDSSSSSSDSSSSSSSSTD